MGNRASRHESEAGYTRAMLATQSTLRGSKGTERLFLHGATSFLEVFGWDCGFAVSAPLGVWKVTSFTPNPPSMLAHH